ncbi:hypothetical protein BV898_06303 [Hypsibius exemplaris]|uniref:Uncharacterized protein n=1 Tax=Hypsibius exemplaris TaxID=2072580 RepID=A0A1W0WX36_HYPEX|nr:hypothetical protein BV898_06303 [Hypsibius exemplaris]
MRSTLSAILSFLGLYVPTTKLSDAAISHTICGLIWVALSFFAFLYEATHNVTYFIEAPKGALQISDVVFKTTFLVKTATTLIVLVTFWRKSPVLHYGKRYINSVPIHQEHGRTASFIGFLTLVTFMCYLVTQTSSRLCDLFASDPWPVVRFPFFPVTYLQEQLFVLFAHNLTEAIRLLCSGFLGMFLVDACSNLADTCRRLMEDVHRRGGTTMTAMELSKIWAARENALVIAEYVQKELGILITVIFATDIVCLTCVVSEGFSGTYYQFFRMGASSVLYLVSLFCIMNGLLSLSDTDEVTLNLLQKLQSSIAQGALPRPALDDNAQVTSQTLALSCGAISELLKLMDTMRSACFETRQVRLRVLGFGHVTRGTIISTDRANTSKGHKLLKFFLFLSTITFTFPSITPISPSLLYTNFLGRSTEKTFPHFEFFCQVHHYSSPMDQHHGGPTVDPLHRFLKAPHALIGLPFKEIKDNVEKSIGPTRNFKLLIKLDQDWEKQDLTGQAFLLKSCSEKDAEKRIIIKATRGIGEMEIINTIYKAPIEFVPRVENNKSVTFVDKGKEFTHKDRKEENKTFINDISLDFTMRDFIVYVGVDQVGVHHLEYLKINFNWIKKKKVTTCDISMGFKDAAKAMEFCKGMYHTLRGIEFKVGNVWTDAPVWIRPQVLQDIEDQLPEVPGTILIRGLDPKYSKEYIKERARGDLKSLGRINFTVEMLTHNGQFRCTALLHFSSTDAKDVIVAVDTYNKKQQEAAKNKKIEGLRYQLFKGF